MDVSFGTIWEAIARDQPDSVAISEPGRDYTFAEFDDRSARLAAALSAAGVGPGDKVACYLYNGAAYLETVFAAFKIGAVPVNANYRYRQDELTALLADADAAALVFSGDLAANVAHGEPTVTGFTETFAMATGFLVVAFLAGLLVPKVQTAPSEEAAADTSHGEATAAALETA